MAGADFHCFKAGIEPKWEDPSCASGGKWTANLPKGSSKALLDTFWLHTVRPSVRCALGFLLLPPLYLGLGWAGLGWGSPIPSMNE